MNIKNKFKYNDPYFSEILTKRSELFFIRNNVLKIINFDKSQSDNYTDNYTKKEFYTDFIRLAFILGEPFIGKFGYEKIFD